MGLFSSPGSIDYNGYTLQVMRFDSGWRVIIRRHWGLFAHFETPNGPDRDAVIAEAKAIVDRIK
jgi:hypothetical protein